MELGCQEQKHNSWLTQWQRGANRLKTTRNFMGEKETLNSSLKINTPFT